MIRTKSTLPTINTNIYLLKTRTENMTIQTLVQQPEVSISVIQGFQKTERFSVNSVCIRTTLNINSIPF